MSLGKERPIYEATVGAGQTHYALFYPSGQRDCSLQCQAIGTASATSLKLYGSNIYTDTTSGPIATSFTNKEWVEMTTTGGTLPTGADWTDAFKIGATQFRVLCLVIVNNTGTSAYKVFAYGK